jgi:hypothetical protein
MSTLAKVSAIFAAIKLQHSQFLRRIARSEFNGFAGKDWELLWRFQLFCFFFLTPETRHLKPCNLVLGI